MQNLFANHNNNINQLFDPSKIDKQSLQQIQMEKQQQNPQDLQHSHEVVQGMQFKRENQRIQIRKKRTKELFMKKRNGLQNKCTQEKTQEIQNFLDQFLNLMQSKNFTFNDIENNLKIMQLHVKQQSECLDNYNRSVQLTEELEKIIQMSCSVDLETMNEQQCQVLNLTLYCINNLVMNEANTPGVINSVADLIKIIDKSSSVRVKSEAINVLGNMLGDEIESINVPIINALQQCQFITSLLTFTKNFADVYVKNSELDQSDITETVDNICRLIYNFTIRSKEINVSSEIQELICAFQILCMSLNENITTYSRQFIVDATTFVLQIVNSDVREELFNHHTFFFIDLINIGVQSQHWDQQEEDIANIQQQLSVLFQELVKFQSEMTKNLIDCGIFELAKVLVDSLNTTTQKRGFDLLSELINAAEISAIRQLLKLNKKVFQDPNYFIVKASVLLQQGDYKVQDAIVTFYLFIMENGTKDHFDILQKCGNLEFVLNEAFDVNRTPDYLQHIIQILEFYIFFGATLSNEDFNLFIKDEKKDCSNLCNVEDINRDKEQVYKNNQNLLNVLSNQTLLDKLYALQANPNTPDKLFERISTIIDTINGDDTLLQEQLQQQQQQ